MLSVKRWAEIDAERPVDGFDFVAADEETLEELEAAPELAKAAFSELLRVYAAYRLTVTKRRFGMGETPAHQRMREQGMRAIKSMIRAGTTPALVLKDISDGLSRWSKLQVVPWTMYTSDKFILRAPVPRRGTLASAGKTKTHSFSSAAERLHPELRKRLIHKWGDEKVAALARDDESLYVDVQARAIELRSNPRLYLPASVRDVVRWLAKEPWL